MDLKFNTPIDEIIKRRTSVRTYSEELVTEEIIGKINAYISTLSNPFNVKINFKLIESDTAKSGAKLGTYGIIRGAKHYIGASLRNEDFAMEALGYEFEELILYITSLGLGTCWLGGTFNRGAFGKAMAVGENEIFPAITPFGFPANRRSLSDKIIRSIAKGDSRKDWNELFFSKNLSEPLSISDAGEFALSLEMVRLAPSASNKQPWRIIKDENVYHFCEYKNPGYSNAFGYDIQRLDIGIAACHFRLAAAEKGLEGQFQRLSDKVFKLPENVIYAFSWVSE